jgi:broad specificity phosphatase PhoE
MSRIYLVRHGQAAFGPDGIGGLTPVGRRQCEALASHWRAIGRSTDLVFCGALARQRESAEAFAMSFAAPGEPDVKVRVIPGIEEYDHLALVAAHARASGESADAEGLAGRLVPALQAWVAGGLPGVESFSAFRARCQAALEAVIEATGRARRAVLFGSGGSLAAAMQPFLGVGDLDLVRLKLTFYNTGVSCLLSDGSRVTIESLNAIGHLEQPALLPLITRR